MQQADSPSRVVHLPTIDSIIAAQRKAASDNDIAGFQEHDERVSCGIRSRRGPDGGPRVAAERARGPRRPVRIICCRPLECCSYGSEIERNCDGPAPADPAARSTAVEAPRSILRRGGPPLGISQNPGHPAHQPVSIDSVSSKSRAEQHLEDRWIGMKAWPLNRTSVERFFDRYFVQVTVLPTFLMMVCVFGLPLVFSFYLSFTGWGLDQPLFAGRFVGLTNYDDVLTNAVYTKAIYITLGYTAATVAAQMLLGLGIALLLNVDLPGMRVFRTALIVPMMITPIVGALCWKLLLDPSHGVFNLWIGQQIVWLGRSDTALAAIWVVGVWQNTAYVTLILLAGLRSLPTEPLEAASIDGANRLQAFWLVTLPMLRPYILVALLLRTIFEFRAFDNVYAMTGGGPANTTMVLSMYTYLVSFVQFDFSLGAAASWLMLLMAMLMCLFFIAVIRRREAL